MDNRFSKWRIEEKCQKVLENQKDDDILSEIETKVVYPFLKNETKVFLTFVPQSFALILYFFLIIKKTKITYRISEITNPLR